MTKVEPAGPETQSRRVKSLDGLRGLAALVVLFHHVSLAWPVLANPYRGQPTHGLAWVLTYTPVRVLLSGPEAVLVFFVLSGVVLTRPVLVAQGSFPWAGYYVRRLLRLYLPVWASLLLATALVFARSGGSVPSWVYAGREIPSLTRLVGDAALVGGVGRLNSPLWSLRWEVLFSLLLPLYVLGGRRLRSRPVVVAVVVAALVVLGKHWHHDSLVYLPVFAAGGLLAARWDDLAAGARRMSRTGWGSLLVLGLVLLTSVWAAQGLGLSWRRSQVVCMPLVLLGAVVLVVCFGFSPACQRLAERRWCQLLGQRAFSLYVVHWPVTWFVFALFGHHVAWAALLAVSGSLVTADIFFRLVERPSTQLARRVGRM